MERDVSVLQKNAAAVARDRERISAGERLIGRDAAAVFAPDLTGVRGDCAATSELLFRAGDSARKHLSDTPARLSFVRAQIEKAGLSESDLFPVLPAEKPLRVLYARIGAADNAYRLVAGILSDPRVGYAESNPDAAEGVGGGDADLLLLPYADAEGNSVLSTETLSWTHGLYLTALARVRSGLLYGLFGRAILPGQSGRVTLHFSLPSPDSQTLADVFDLAREAGLNPDGTEIPSGERRATFALSGAKSDCLAAAVYFLAFCPGCELRGWRGEKPLSE